MSKVNFPAAASDDHPTTQPGDLFVRGREPLATPRIEDRADQVLKGHFDRFYVVGGIQVRRLRERSAYASARVADDHLPLVVMVRGLAAALGGVDLSHDETIGA